MSPRIRAAGGIRQRRERQLPRNDLNSLPRRQRHWFYVVAATALSNRLSLVAQSRHHSHVDNPFRGCRKRTVSAAEPLDPAWLLSGMGGNVIGPPPAALEVSRGLAVPRDVSGAVRVRSLPTAVRKRWGVHRATMVGTDRRVRV
jgi:hypothetical protein